MSDSTLCYEVPGVELIVQDKTMACWYASAMMVVNWVDGKRSICSSVDDQTINIYKANTGIQNPQIIPLAKRLGLVPVPALCPTVDALFNWLGCYGPLWTNGVRHIVVIAGIRGDEGNGFDLKVYDPWPGNGISWRTLAGWYTGFNPGVYGASSRDTSDSVEAVFLHA